MYCYKCGVELGDAEKKCPLCGTEVPVFEGVTDKKTYPDFRIENGDVPRTGIMTFITFLLLIPAVICLMVDIRINSGIVWSGYAALGIAVGYVMFLLPLWFGRANPVIFTPVSFIAISGYLVYVCCKTGGHWYLTLAFPITVGAMLITTAAVTLFKYLKKGKLFVLGGLFIALAAFIVLIEFFVSLTFGTGMFVWSIYPFAILVILGALTVAVAASPKMSSWFRRKMFF